MLLMKARVTGFQSFKDSGVLYFNSGINLIVGANNVGKSALLRALRSELPDDRHRSPQEFRDEALPAPTVDLEIEICGNDVKQAVFTVGPIVIPAAPEASSDPVGYVDGIMNGEPFVVNIRHSPNSTFVSPYPSHGLFYWSGQGRQAAARLSVKNGDIVLEPHFNGDDSLPSAVHYLWRANMFYFSAERFSVGQTNTAHVERLDQNASNLAAVLHTLAGDRGDLFDKLISHLREMFPTVGHLSTRVLPGNAGLTEVRVWPTLERQNVRLSFPLMQSGTGVAQTVALLVAIMTIDRAVILIDEINSFLHPAAVKALLRILQTEYAQHQYIISTHAPEVIGYSNATTVHLVKRSGYESTISALNPNEITTFREVAAHLGVSMSDVFAADSVIWVEGETEETLFPYIYRELVGPVPRGTVFTTVAATGDFGAKRRDKSMVYEAYSRLSAAVATMPIKVVFGFDTEKLSNSDKVDMVRDSQGRLKFLPRRHVECYLLHPESIAARIRDKDPNSKVTNSDVVSKIIEIASEHPFALNDTPPDLENPDWLARIDAARLLSKLFTLVSDARIEYDKTTDGIEIAKQILANDREFISPLADYVRELVEHVQA